MVDFDEQKVGSDLWLFWQTSNKNINDVVVLLTPSFDGKAWYEKNQNKNQIIIKASQDGPASTRSPRFGEAGSLGEAGEVSFRFTAPRKDAAQWPNEITK
ncbi:MAG: hypothetical protein HYS15_00580 [Candidatus Spechtbacteria bacterium]|nr:hypothetical protein [Candidatus Spechtbacteria bacterium]